MKTRKRKVWFSEHGSSKDSENDGNIQDPDNLSDVTTKIGPPKKKRVSHQLQGCVMLT
jgi:hypothetical protein